MVRFRAWHKKLKMMRDVKLIAWLEDGLIGLHLDCMPDGRGQFQLNEDIELMQWTGLNDVTGKCIFEGDIVDRMFGTINGDTHNIGIIKFGEHETSDDYYASTAYGFYIEYVISPHQSTVDSLPHDNLRVVGNVWENSELLEEAK